MVIPKNKIDSFLKTLYYLKEIVDINFKEYKENFKIYLLGYELFRMLDYNNTKNLKKEKDNLVFLIKNKKNGKEKIKKIPYSENIKEFLKISELQNFIEIMKKNSLIEINQNFEKYIGNNQFLFNYIKELFNAVIIELDKNIKEILIRYPTLIKEIEKEKEELIKKQLTNYETLIEKDIKNELKKLILEKINNFIKNLENQIENLERKINKDKINENLNSQHLFNILKGSRKEDLNYQIKFIENLIKNKKENENIYFISLDANNFKKINDKYGHDIGDKTLYLLGEYLKENYEFSFRLGGDEFISIFNDKEKLKKVLKDLFLTHIKINNDIGASFSVGISEIKVKQLKEYLNSIKNIINNKTEENVNIINPFIEAWKKSDQNAKLIKSVFHYKHPNRENKKSDRHSYIKGIQLVNQIFRKFINNTKFDAKDLWKKTKYSINETSINEYYGNNLENYFMK